MDNVTDPAGLPDDFDPTHPPLPDWTYMKEGDENRRQKLASENLSGTIEQHAEYAELTDAGLVRRVGQPDGNVAPNASSGALAELNRRQTEALREHATSTKKSSDATYTLAWAMFVLAGLNLIMFVWLVSTG